KVEVGYLNYSQPRFEAVVETAVSQGYEQITVLPYFLVDGYFVQKYLLELISAAQQKHSLLSFSYGKPLGDHRAMASAIDNSAQNAKEVSCWRQAWSNYNHYCQANETCPNFKAELCLTAHRHVLASRKINDAYLPKSTFSLNAETKVFPTESALL